MEVHFSPNVQARLDRMTLLSGRDTHELLEDALVGYLDEVTVAGELLDRRYDDLASGRVLPIDGEEAYRTLKARTEEQRQRSRRP
jgi:predicted transcriptional regulator